MWGHTFVLLTESTDFGAKSRAILAVPVFYSVLATELHAYSLFLHTVKPV